MIISLITKIEYNINTFNNNSLLTRFVLAFAVFYSHMFAIYGLEEPTLLFGNHSLGWYAVNGFFFISGLLVAQSYQNRDLCSYLMARFFRIMPAYLASLIVVLITVLLFNNIQFNFEWFYKFLKFLFQNFVPLDSADTSMSGIWLNSAQPNALNNSLWTIPFEIFCYIVIIPLLLSNTKYKPRSFLLFVIAIFIYLKLLGAISFSHISLDLLRVFVYFGIGVTMYLIVKEKKINIYFIFFCSILVLFEGNIKETILGYVIILSILYFGFYVKTIFTIKNDYSYGWYIYAWPISQAVNGGGGNSKYLQCINCFICLFIVYFVGKLEIFRKTSFNVEK